MGAVKEFQGFPGMLQEISGFFVKLVVIWVSEGLHGVFRGYFRGARWLRWCFEGPQGWCFRSALWGFLECCKKFQGDPETPGKIFGPIYIPQEQNLFWCFFFVPCTLCAKFSFFHALFKFMRIFLDILDKIIVKGALYKKMFQCTFR